MIIYLKDKFEVDAILTKSFLEVGRENIITQVWKKRGKVEQRYFHCQKYRHLACKCKDIIVCGNCAQTGYYFQDYLTITLKSANYEGNHQAKNYKHQQKEVLFGS